jgi:hypothetical protein
MDRTSHLQGYGTPYHYISGLLKLFKLISSPKTADFWDSPGENVHTKFERIPPEYTTKSLPPSPNSRLLFFLAVD